MQFYQLFHSQLAQAVFGKQICRIYFACNFAEVDATEADGLLDPESMGIQMPKFAEALPVADAYSRAGICPHAQVGFYTKVAEQRLVSEALAGSTNDACELGFAGAQRDGRLRGGPMLDGVAPQE